MQRSDAVETNEGHVNGASKSVYRGRPSAVKGEPGYF